MEERRVVDAPERRRGPVVEATDDEVEDRWLVIGRRVDDSGQVMTARTFLLGEGSGRFALHLAFGVDAAPRFTACRPG